MIEWKLQSLSIKVLKNHPKNPRQINKDQLRHLEGLIKKFGLIDKPIVNFDYTIIGGHQRIRILKKMKKKEVECWVASEQLSDEDIDHLCIALNLNQGEFDFDILANEWEPIDLLKWGFTEAQLLGLSEKDCDDLLNDEEEEIEVDEEKEAITQLGDLYELGEHLLLCGDSTRADDVSRVMANHDRIFVLTDPPYGINVKICDGKKHGKAKCKRNKFDEILGDESNAVAQSAFALCLSLNLNFGIWWGANYYANILPNSSCWIIWDKNTGSNNFPDAELAWCSDRSPVRIFKHTWNGMIKQSEIGQKRIHPTQKPVALAKWCLQTYASKFVNILDLFGGSGSTLLACEELKKKCAMIELSPIYCDVIVNRWINYRKKHNLSYEFIRNGQKIQSLTQEVLDGN